MCVGAGLDPARDHRHNPTNPLRRGTNLRVRPLMSAQPYGVVEANGVRPLGRGCGFHGGTGVDFGVGCGFRKGAIHCARYGVITNARECES